jgi:hypothetical protein
VLSVQLRCWSHLNIRLPGPENVSSIISSGFATFAGSGSLIRQKQEKLAPFEPGGLMKYTDMMTVIVVFGTFFLALKSYLDYRTRKQLIERGKVDETVKFLYQNQGEALVPSSLKWGLVALGIGLAVLIGQLFVPWDYQGEVTISLMFIFGGVGLIIHYIIADKRMKAQRRSQPQ